MHLLRSPLPPLPGDQVFVTFFGTNLSTIHTEVNKDVIALVCLGVLSFGAYTLQHYMFGIVGEHLTRRVREGMLRAILRYEVGGWVDWFLGGLCLL